MAEATMIGQLLAGDSPSVVKTFSTLLFPVLLLIVLLRYLSAGPKTSNSKQGKRLPPSPPSLPLLGHLHLVGTHPHVSLRDLAVKHGELMLLRRGMVPTIVVSSPSAAQAVLRTHDLSMSSRPSSYFGDIISFGPSNVSLTKGDKWRQAKKLLNTHMLSAKKVQSFRATREEEVGLVIDQIRSAAMTNAAVDLTELLSSFTSDIVSRLVAGRSFREGGLNKKFKEVLDASMVLLGGFDLESCYPGLANMGGGVLMWLGRRKARELRDRWQAVLDGVIDQHARAAAAAGGRPALHDESDFTDVLLSKKEEYGLTRDGLRGMLAEMFAAGTDTTHLVLEFTMARLMMNQDVMARLQAEVRSMMPKGQQLVTDDHITGMPYLKAVIKETLRLHPPAPLLIPHLSIEECTIDGYVVPAGTTVLVNVWAIGRDPRFWDDAEEYKPERFINKGAALDLKGSDFQYLPFGSGRRICPGVDFAMANVEMMLANLVCHFDWDFTGGSTEIDMTEVFGLTVHRKEKLTLTPRLRSS